MKVRIGIANTDKLVEIEIDDATQFKTELEATVAGGEIAWFTDSKGRTVGIPSQRVAFVEIDGEQAGAAIGFAPAV